MRFRYFIFYALFVGLVVGATYSRAQFNQSALSSATSSGGGGTAVAWNPSDKDTAITLSTTNYTNDTATQSGASAAWRSVRGTNSPAKTLGKWHIEFLIQAMDGANGVIMGVADGSSSLTNYCGSDAHAISVQVQVAGTPIIDVYYNGGATSYSAPFIHNNDRIAVEIDIPNKLFWANDLTGGISATPTGWTDNAGGFTGDPTNSTSGGGTSFGSLVTTGGVMPCFSGDDNTTADTVTLFPTSAGFIGTPSTGYSPWS